MSKYVTDIITIERLHSMGDGFNRKKWWHTDLVLNRAGLIFTVLSTRQSGPNQNSSSKVFATITNPPNVDGEIPLSLCESETGINLDLPIPAFNSLYHPGFFIYRPTFADISPAVVTVNSFAETQDASNGTKFLFDLYIAYDQNDETCNTNGPPNAHDPDRFRRTEKNSIIFRFDSIPLLDQIGCCNIDLEVPEGDILEPGSMVPSTRLWMAVRKNAFFQGERDIFDYHLISYDTTKSLSNGIEDRGNIRTNQDEGVGEILDLAWDDRNMLWAIEKRGLRLLSPGNSVRSAALLNFVNISGIGSDEIFPVEFSPSQSSAMKPPFSEASITYNQQNQMLYISSNGKLFELKKLNGNDWEINRFAELPGPIVRTDVDGLDRSVGAVSNRTLSGLAVDSFGKMKGLHGGTLVDINIQDSFGQLRSSSGQDSDLNFWVFFSSMDYLPDSSGSEAALLYGTSITNNFDIWLMKPSFENSTDLGDFDFSSIIGNEFNNDSAIYGMSSGQAGEDLSEPDFPFYTNDGPWIFMIESSQNMLRNIFDDEIGSTGSSRWNAVVDALFSFILSLGFNSKISVILYGRNDGGDSPIEFQSTIRKTSDQSNIIEQISNVFPINSSDPINASFCDALDVLQNSAYQNTKNLFVIGASQFENCPTNNEFENLVQNKLSIFKQNSPDVVIRSVGVNPFSRSQLEFIGNSEDGYIEWVQ